MSQVFARELYGLGGPRGSGTLLATLVLTGQGLPVHASSRQRLEGLNRLSVKKAQREYLWVKTWPLQIILPMGSESGSHKPRAR